MQQRSRETRDAVIDALEALLAEKPIEDLTIAELASRAGVSVGTIYRRFDGKHALRKAVLDLYENRLEAWVSDPANQVHIPGDYKLIQALELLAQAAWTQINAQPELMRAAMAVSQADPTLFRDRFEPLLAASYGGFEQLLAHFLDDTEPVELARRTRMIFYFFQTIMLDNGLYPGSLGRFGPPEDVDFPREIARFAYGYLTAELD